ncbi:MAG: universal stress protein [Granulosicoccus sp.]|nr:universal stress protein [Granulosicoccus sp.]
MSYKTLLVCLANEAEAQRLIPVSIMLARRFDAHLIGLYSLQNMEIYASVSMQLSGLALTQLKESQQAQAARVKAIFDEQTRAEEFVAEWRQIETSVASTGERLCEHARCADLVIMSQQDAELEHPGPEVILRRVIEHSGRPVLVIPRFGEFPTIGKRSLIGWSGTGESARAAHDGIPFMQQGEETRVFWVSGSDSEADSKLEFSAHEIARSLDRHGIKATVAHRTKSQIPIGDELLNEAADTGSDLIITGAYGHSRLYDFVIGATTTHLLAYMTSPVLFSS